MRETEGFGGRGLAVRRTILPGLAVGGFDVAGEKRGVHEGGGLHLFAERGAEGLEAGRIGGELLGEGEELVGGLGDEVGEADGGEEADADARHVAVAGEGEDGDAHPEGFAGGGGAVVGEGVEGDVEAVVAFEVAGVVGEFGEEGEAVGGDGVFGEELVEAGGGFGAGGGFEGEAGVGDGLEDAGPEVEGGVVDFGEVVEAAEGDVVVGEVRGRGDGGSAGEGGEAPGGLREAEEAFRVVGGLRKLLAGNWIGDGVGEAVVDGGEAGGAGVAEPGDLERGGFSGEEHEAAIGGVSGEVDEDVDFVLADLVEGVLVGEVGEGMPLVGGGAEAGGDFVGLEIVGIAGDMEVGMVVGFQQGEEEEGDGVEAEVGGDVADAEGAVGGAVDVGWRRGGGDVERVGPAAACFVELGGGGGGVVAVGEEVIVVGGGEVGEEGDGLAEGGECGIVLGEILEDGSGVVVGVGVVGVEGEGAAAGGEGFFAAVGGVEGDGEVVEGAGKIGSQGEGFLVGGDGLVEEVEFGEVDAEIVQGVGVIGAEGEAFLAGGDAVARAAGEVEHVGEIGGDGGIGGAEGLGFFGGGDGVGGAGLGEEDEAEVDVKIGVFGGELEGLAEEGFGGGVVAEFVRDAGEAVEDIGLAGIEGENLAEEGLGFAEAAGVVVFDGGGEDLFEGHGRETWLSGGKVTSKDCWTVRKRSVARLTGKPRMSVAAWR